MPVKYFDILRNPANRDPRGFDRPSDQPDFLTATKFVNALIKNGITIHRATSSFQVAGKTYPAGSYVIQPARAFRPHVLDMFEPQDHPDDIPYPEARPRRLMIARAGRWPIKWESYSIAGLLEAFDGPFEKITGWAKPPAGKVGSASAAGGT